jgi:S-adenosylmethionine hydrolase
MVGDWVVGEVVEVDRFGNLVTNLPPGLVQEAGELEFSGRWIPLHGTYGEVAPGELLALVNSDGRVEIGLREGSAAAHLRAGRGAGVRTKAPTAPPVNAEAGPD